MLLPANLISTQPAQLVTNFRPLRADAERLIALIDGGIRRPDGSKASCAALHHAQLRQSPFNFFVVSTQYMHLFNNRRIIVNPKITDQKTLVPFEEGCMSFMDRPYAKTRRFQEIKMECDRVRADDELRSMFAETFRDFAAILIQHEVDHGLGKHIHDGQFAEYNPRLAMNHAVAL